ncbi:Uncharacterised protein [uncultured archaeon]|nr:Uncharacterised protein [uncultured archaeon]
MTKELISEQATLTEKMYPPIYWTCFGMILMWCIFKLAGVI